MSLILQFHDILEASRTQLSNIKPSEWAEKHRIMKSGESQYKGPFSYSRTPYCREIVDCMAPDHPAKVVAVMKGAQLGFSTGVIEPAIGWIISENPGNILFLTGHTELAEEAVAKLDVMIDNCGIRHLIKPTAVRKKAAKTGDTNSKKEFAGGSLVSGGASNHKLMRQRTIQYGFIDDFEAAKSSTKESGNTRLMIEQRLAAFASSMKLNYTSTPELKATSNIEPIYLIGDQRRWFMPCPCCGAQIYFEWSIPLNGDEKDMAGITWKTDASHKLISDSVGYICQECGGFFTDKNKLSMLQAGEWKPTAEPQRPNYYSYHLSSLYAPPGMYSWEHYVRNYLEANPADAKRNETLHQAFVNLVLGQTYEPTGETQKASDLQKNIRNYEIGTVPEKLSLADGNGKIVMITCAADMNGTIFSESKGTIDDARLDYEVIAWAESGASYSITHGSIGTFIPKENTMRIKADRERWTYEFNKPFSVWKELEKVMNTLYITDTTPSRRMPIFFTGLDSGHYTQFAYAFKDKHARVYCLKGKNVEKFVRDDADKRTFTPAKERSGLYLVEVNMLKDQLRDRMLLKFDEHNDTEQPPGFMNFPTPSGGRYLLKNYFEHFESEQRLPETTKDGKVVGSMWQKKSSAHQNHFWDVNIYNMVMKDIITHILCTELKIKNYTWADCVDIILGRYKP